jgi:hypothetical protein
LGSMDEFKVMLKKRTRELGDEHTEITLSLISSPTEIYVDSKSIEEIRFHLFDFFQFNSAEKLVGSDSVLNGMILKGAEWTIRINSLKNTYKNIEQTKLDGITRLTHVASLRKSDDADFSAGDFSDVWPMLVNYFTFLKGGRNWPVMSTGYNNERVVFRSWSAPLLSRNGSSWFNPYDVSQAEEFFPLFSKRWNQSSAWRESLDRAIYWYTQANTKGGVPGIDAAIILAQTALERLAYHYVVIDRCMISEYGFDNLRASDKLRLLIVILGISTDIPDTSKKIISVASEMKWQDIPHALTDIRNSLVHPKKKKIELIQQCYFEAWNLSIWLLELSILGVCGYQGEYRNRLSMPYMITEPVPWAKKDRGDSTDE